MEYYGVISSLISESYQQSDFCRRFQQLIGSFIYIVIRISSRRKTKGFRMILDYITYMYTQIQKQ